MNPITIESLIFGGDAMRVPTIKEKGIGMKYLVYKWSRSYVFITKSLSYMFFINSKSQRISEFTITDYPDEGDVKTFSALRLSKDKAPISLCI